MRTFLLGAVAFGAVTYVFVAALALVVGAGGSTMHIGLGPLVLVEVERDADATTTVVVGWGLLAATVVGGTVNLLAARALRRRRDRESIT